MTAFTPYVVADIGGTNARFGLVTKDNGGDQSFAIENMQTYASASFHNIEQATRQYIESLNGERISGACLAVAGPVTGDTVRLTNLNWAFSINDVKRTLGLSRLKVLNDFAAYAFATPHISAAHLLSLNEGQALEGSPIAIVGPGTGFGVAALVPQSKHWNVLPTEGGQITLAAKTPLQFSVLSVLSHELSHISVENVLSGPGLSRLYLALAKVEGVTVQALSASEITAKATTDSKSLEYRTLCLFCAWLGQTCGNLALTLGARGGLYLGGGVLLKFIDFLVKSEFLNCFFAKGQMQEYLHQIPIKLVTKSNSALLGAAAWYKD